jgi:hypothetical protein
MWYWRLKDCEVGRGMRKSWHANVTLWHSLVPLQKVKGVFITSVIIVWAKGRSVTLNWVCRAIWNTKHEIMLQVSYLQRSNSIILWSLGASFRAKCLRLNIECRSSLEYVCLRVVSFVLHPRLICVYRWRILFLYSCSACVYTAQLFSRTHVLFVCIWGDFSYCTHVTFSLCLCSQVNNIVDSKDRFVFLRTVFVEQVVTLALL